MTRIAHGLFSLLFVFLYWTPFLLENTGLAVSDERARVLLAEAWKSGAVREGILLFLGGSLLLCFCAMWLFSLLGKHLAALLRISYTLAHAIALLAGWIMLVTVNSWWFPLSNYSYSLSTLRSPLLGKFMLGLFVVLLLVTVARALPSVSRRQWFGFSCVALGGLGYWAVSGAVQVKPQYGRSVILIGVDSLSAHAFARTAEQMPVLHALHEKSVSYSRAYTPLGRTYPAWLSILSGKYPQQHGAVFNLRALEHVDSRQLLSSELQDRGFRTVFAIDERRFNNLNEGFGFDAIVGPKAGVLDFALQNLADTPLTNLALQTAPAKWLFPYSYVNTAAYTSYSDTDFVQSVLDSVDGGGRVFLAVHFEAAHFPFKTRHASVEMRTGNAFWDAHVEALSAVDRQVAMLMTALGRKGLLEDALVVLLSDHGEGLGEVERRLTVDGEPFDVVGYGHGADVLSDRQNRVLLATLTYKNGKVVNNPREVTSQVALTDLRKATEDYLAGDDSPYIQAPERCMMIETGIRFPAAANYKTLNEAELAGQAASYYEVNVRGQMQLRESELPGLVSEKDIGVRCPERLSYYVARDDRIKSFSLDEGGLPVRQITPPADDITKIEAYRAAYSRQFPPVGARPATLDH